MTPTTRRGASVEYGGGQGDDKRPATALSWPDPMVGTTTDSLRRREQDERLLHASSFGAVAAAYAEHRPDYARAAVRWALEPAPGTTTRILRS
jgi:hypothetical protein